MKRMRSLGVVAAALLYLIVAALPARATNTVSVTMKPPSSLVQRQPGAARPGGDLRGLQRPLHGDRPGKHQGLAGAGLAGDAADRYADSHHRHHQPGPVQGSGFRSVR
jgi:hypothetical protein